MYRFGTEKNDSTSSVAVSKMDLKETSQLYNTCKKAGLTNFHSSTIATLMNQIEMNLDFKESAEAPSTSEEPPVEDGKKKRKSKKSSPADAGTVTVD